MRIKIGSRSSDLARIQAYTVGNLLKAKGHEVEYNFRESLGDLNPDIDLSKTVEKGVFTQDFHQGLIDGTYDLVVHSWKDLPTEERPGTEVVATLEREDMRDVLLIKKSSLSSLNHVRIFSSSPRRAYNLKSFLAWALPQPVSEVEFVNVRGNVPTRLRKLRDTQDIDGLIVAKAALDRMLGSPLPELQAVKAELRELMAGFEWMVLPLSINPCAAAQGALALEIASGRDDILKAVKELNCDVTWRTVRKEREILKAFGGGCHQKIGVSVLERAYGEILFLQGLTDSGEVLNKFELKGARVPAKVKDAREVYPAPGDEPLSFDYEILPVETSSLDGQDLWIAKDMALPQSYRPQGLVWTAGLKSWRKLAARGLWVNGCSEALGEKEAEAVDILAGRRPQWIKLSHEGGVAFEGKPLVATYRLKGDLDPAQIEDKKYFYWQSGSQFMSVFKTHREVLLKGHHACGPGHTYSIITSVLQAPVSIFLCVEDWWQALGVGERS